VTARLALLAALALVGGIFAVRWTASLRAAAGPLRPTAYEVFVGVLTDFFDTLGIGSFAPTTALFKARGRVSDELIPGTLNVGHTVPTLIQAFIYIVIVRVEPVTLALMIGASVEGAWIGAGVVPGPAPCAVPDLFELVSVLGRSHGPHRRALHPPRGRAFGALEKRRGAGRFPRNASGRGQFAGAGYVSHRNH
jgi:hypothetical protein